MTDRPFREKARSLAANENLYLIEQSRMADAIESALTEARNSVLDEALACLLSTDSQHARDAIRALKLPTVTK